MQPSSIPLLLLCSRRGPRSPPPRRLRGGGHLDGREREQLHHAPPPRLGRSLPPARCGARVVAGASGSGGVREWGWWIRWAPAWRREGAGAGAFGTWVQGRGGACGREGYPGSRMEFRSF